MSFEEGDCFFSPESTAGSSEAEFNRSRLSFQRFSVSTVRNKS